MKESAHGWADIEITITANSITYGEALASHTLQAQVTSESYLFSLENLYSFSSVFIFLVKGV